jgi:hypothetical protein
MATALMFSANDLLAQNNGGGGGGRGGRGGGNFDPAQFQQRMMERYKEQLEFKDDTEWKAVQPLVQKVMDARMSSFRGGFGGRRGGGPGGGGTQPSNPEADALQKAIDAKASNAELKAAVTKFVETRKIKQAELEKAQTDLRKVLTVRQEAIATSMGLL